MFAQPGPKIQPIEDTAGIGPHDPWGDPDPYPSPADPNFRLIRAYTYPEASVYAGPYTEAWVKFKVPLPDQVPIVDDWLAGRAQEDILQAAQAKGAHLLQVFVYRNTAPIFHTDYLVVLRGHQDLLTTAIVIGIVLLAFAAIGVKLYGIVVEKLEHKQWGPMGDIGQSLAEATKKGDITPSEEVALYTQAAQATKEAVQATRPSGGSPGLLDWAKWAGIGLLGLGALMLLAQFAPRRR